MKKSLVFMFVMWLMLALVFILSACQSNPDMPTVDAKPITDFLAVLAQGILVIILPVAGKFVIDWVKAKVAIARAGLSAAENQQIDDVIRTLVVAAQQLKANKVLPDGAAAKAYVLNAVQAELDRRGIAIDAAYVSDAVEARYNLIASNNSSYTVLEIFSEAISIATNAYKSSGLSDEAKRVAVAVAEKYLRQFGMTVDADVLEAAILARIASLPAAVQ